MNYEVIETKEKGVFVCRSKKTENNPRRKTFIKGDRKTAIKKLRQLYLSQNRQKRGTKPPKKKPLPKVILKEKVESDKKDN